MAVVPAVSRAATVLSYNGVRCIIAKSFARIFFRNAFNSGILLLTCDQIQDVCEGGDSCYGRCRRTDGQCKWKDLQGWCKFLKICITFVANGGLIEDTKKRLAAGNVKMDIKPLSMEQCRKKATPCRKDIKEKCRKRTCGSWRYRDHKARYVHDP